MEIKKTGLILYTEKYQETVNFYRNIFGLEILYEKEDLTCLDFQGSYLMIEVDDEVSLKNHTKGRAKFCVRFNVSDVKQACKELEEHNIRYDYYEFDWGEIAKFQDPDGNNVGIRSAKEHDSDIVRAKS